MFKVHLVGRVDSREAYKLRDFLKRSTVEFDWTELPCDAPADVIHPARFHAEDLPVCVLPGGMIVKNATIPAVAVRLGWVQSPKLKEYDVSIYGAGPAGLSAAVYAASEGLRTVLVERSSVGGQAGSSSLIENFLGYPKGVSGAEFAEKARQQAVRFGAELLLLREGVKAQFHDNRIFVDLADGNKLVAKANICATGVEYLKLGLPEEERLAGRGLYYGAGISEALLCTDETIFVVGGGNSAGQAAVHFSKFARKVVLLVRGASLSESMSRYLIDKLRRMPNLEVRLGQQVTKLEGENLLHGICVRTQDGKEYCEETRKIFVCIGGRPNTEWAKDTPILRDRAGYLVTGPDLRAFAPEGKIPHWPCEREPYYLETSVPGSFAIGDVRHGSTKRMAAAVGEGAMCVTFLHQYLRGLNE